jgi:hypothetical protein
MFYFTIDLTSLEGKSIHPPKALDWWSKLVHLYGSRLFIMQYEDQNNPGPGTFLVYDYRLDQIEFSREKVLIDEIFGGTIRGVVMEEEEQKPLELNFGATDNAGSAEFPVLYTEGEEDFATVAEFILTQKDEKISLAVEYLEKDDLIVLSYYLRTAKEYDRYLMVLQNEEVVLDRKIDRGMKGLSTESFFLFGNQLIFVEDRITLQVYEY